MRDYSQISPRFWTGETGRRLREAGPECQVLAMYLLTAPLSNMTGLYYQPIVAMAHETGLGMDGASKALTRGIQIGFCDYDYENEIVWVKNMAREQIGAHPKRGDKRLKAVPKLIEKFNNSPLYWGFVRAYKEPFGLDIEPPEARGIDGASMGQPGSEGGDGDGDGERDGGEGLSLAGGRVRDRARALTDELAQEFVELHARLRKQLRIRVPAVQPIGEGRDLLMARIVERLAEGDDEIRAAVRHAMSVLEAEAREKRSLQWVRWQAFRPDLFENLLARESRGSKRSAVPHDTEEHEPLPPLPGVA